MGGTESVYHVTVQEYAFNFMFMFALFVAIPITLCFVGPRIFSVIVFCFSMGTSRALKFAVQVGPKSLYPEPPPVTT
jgi:hypothetical protein